MRRLRTAAGFSIFRALLAVFTLVESNGLEAQARQQATMPISPTVVGTYMVDHEQLRLLILWRGAPGWFTGSRDCNPSTYSTANRDREEMSVTLKCGDLMLPWSVDFLNDTATVLQEPVNLASESVVLVDGVGTAAGAPHIVKRWHVSVSGVPFAALLPEVMAAKPELFRELQCDRKVKDAAVQEMLDASCKRLQPGR